MNIPNQLVESINNGRCVIFVGSGLSSRLFTKLGKKYPTWSGLLQAFLDYSFHYDLIEKSEAEMLCEMIKKGNLTMTAQILRDKANDTEFEEFLAGIFRNDNRFDSIHDSIMNLPFSFVLTTNYDAILECVFSYKYNKPIPTYTNLQISSVNNAISKKEYFLFKIHGTYEQLNTIVLTKNDYQALYYNRAYINILKNIFTNFSVLFVGFSYSDPDIEFIVSELSHEFAANNRMHYLLSSEKTYNSLEQEYMKKKERLTIIEYENADGSHSGVDFFFKELSLKVKKKLLLY